MARAKLSFSAPITVPLDCLEQSDGNVRRIRPVPIQSLADSIARRGLSQSLSVHPILDEAGADTGRYRVQAGSRRLEALLLLARQKRLAKNAAIPCLVKTSGLEQEDSLAENTDREGLHPLDQFRAFAALAEKGQGVEEIAAAFSVTPTVVRQRMKLASVSPKLLALYEENALSLDLLMAFALSADHARQEQVWDAIQQRNWLQTAHQIRRLLTENTIPAHDARVQFVGIDAYEAAGGFVLRDLFQEDGGGYLTDPLLLQKLVNGKLEAAAESVRAEGWAWVEAAEDIPYNATYGLRPLVPTAHALSDAEEHDLDTLLNERDALEGSEADAETEQRLRMVKQRIAELESKVPAFAPEDKEIGGSFVSLDGDGRLCIERGFVRPEDEPRSPSDPETPEPHESAADAGETTDWRPGVSAAPVVDRDDDSAALPEKLIADLTTFRTLALRDALANDPDTAMLTLLHTLSLKLVYSYGSHMSCVEIQAHGLLPNVLKDARQTKPAKAIEARTNSWKQALPREARELWDYLVSLGQEDRRALLASSSA